MSDQRRGLLLADIGKTRCRLRFVSPDGAALWAADAAGAAGIATPGAVDLVAQRILDLEATRPRETGAIDRFVIGVAGALAAPLAADALAERLATGLGSPAERVPTIVASDIVTAHLGAFGGGTGTVLVAGTGAVALGVTADGDSTRVDGHGPELGDLGSGAWIGRAGIIAALRARDGAAASTKLHSALDDLLALDAPATRNDVHRWLADGDNLGGRLGAFAPAVLGQAELGDPTAVSIVDEAVDLLTTTAATPGLPTVSVLGGLADHRWFRQRLINRLVEAGLSPIQPLGTALDGALIAAISESLPHERHFHRA